MRFACDNSRSCREQYLFESFDEIVTHHCSPGPLSIDTISPKIIG
jgi:hypothetical protein